MSFEKRESIMQEIQLCLENDGDFYRSTRYPYQLSLLKKLMQKNKYVHSLAVQGWLNVVTSYLKVYARENQIDCWFTILEPSERFIVAERLTHEFHTLALAGEYNGTQLSKKIQFDSNEVK